MSVEIACRSKHTAPATKPLHGAAALESDLIAAISSALDAVLADDRRRPGAYGVAGLPWCQGATAAL